MRRFLLTLAALLALALPARADLAAALVQYADQIANPSRQTIGPAIAALVETGDPAVPRLLAAWADRALGQRKADGAFFIIAEVPGAYALTDPLTGADAGEAPRADITPLRPNAGVRGLIASALVQFQLTDPDAGQRRAALASIAREGDAEKLAALREALDDPDPALAAQKARLERLLTIRFDPDSAARVAAIDGFGADLGLDLRGALNPLLATRRVAAPEPPAGANIAAELTPGDDLATADAFALLVAAGLAPEPLTPQQQREALVANIAGGMVAGIPVAQLSTQAARDRAYTALEAAGAVPVAATQDEIAATVAQYRFFDIYAEADPAVTDAARAALRGITTRVGLMQAADLGLDALSLASIYFLAAVGLAITFGVMRVINMAHGEFIMMGAYTGYCVQLVIADYTLSILVALPLAFAVTFAAGVAMERLVIRHLYKRPLETLLATFGISIALQQIAKNIFGTQARPLTAPAWLDGALSFNDVVSISTIRIAIFVLAVAFLVLILFVMKRTRLGLEVRAVQQNPAMAASMGINPDRINMLTFGLGSGIAGLAGVAIGLFAKVTSELGNDYIVQSFMTVVVGGVGNIWGTLAGAALIGTLQKGIEWLNPSNTLAAQTFMILFIILFIQVRPRGIVALRGRAAGD
ncbi:MAG TPA: urea ABC transporter permease subunit UrtB [Paracoccaceae bacterium]|nr:urea ABC transporter permease subunit UrtB [Paracoccaceae bacterium]